MVQVCCCSAAQWKFSLNKLAQQRSTPLRELASVQLVRDVQEVADVCWGVVLPELEVRGEIAGKEPLPDKDQHCAAYSEQGFLCWADKKVQLKKHRIEGLQSIPGFVLLPGDRQDRSIVCPIYE